MKNEESGMKNFKEFSYLCPVFNYQSAMDKLVTVWNFIRRYKYVITIGIFAVIMGFLDENSMIRRFKNKREIMRLESEIRKYQAEYEESTKKLNELMSNPEAMEKVAREKYLMKKPNEDIYVFEDEE